jgi:ABC-type Zn uptake system ZnuABC Zn-binding protein ZnuA
MAAPRSIARRSGLLVVPFLLVAGACGSAGGSVASSDGRLKVVTTVAPITSIAASVIGTNADITGVVPEGTNSHTFEPAPSVAKVLSAADVIFVNGLKLEDPTVELARKNLKKGARIVSVGDVVLPEADYIFDFSFPKAEGKPNPHLWTDPLYAKKYAEVVKSTLSEVDPGNAAAYDKNYSAFATKVDEFDEAMRASFATMTADQRKLLTYHDAYAYFAKDYGWQVIGAIQVGSFEDPSPREVAALIGQVRDERVRAIFGSEVFPSPVLAHIGQEAGTKYVDVLRDDDLPGRPGEPRHSWLGLMHFDYVTMVEALGGDASALRAFKVENVAPDNAVYPQ